MQSVSTWALLIRALVCLCTEKSKLLPTTKVCGIFFLSDFTTYYLGNRTTPSYVAFTDTERLIGDAAKNQVAMNPENTVFDAKRLIGRKFDDAAVQSDMKHWPFKVINTEGGKPKVQVDYKGEKKTFSPEEISSMVLIKMKVFWCVSFG
jgi:molecular chaperone DnaK (HSP70)